MIVSVGEFSSPIVLYPVGAGIDTVGLMDDDTASTSNLQCQTLYVEDETDPSKTYHAVKRLRALNGRVNIPTHPFRLSSENTRRLIAEYDIIVDRCDNSSTHYLISDSRSALNKSYTYGAVQGSEGQVSVFCHGGRPKTYRDLYPDEAATLQMPAPGKSMISVTPAIVGSVETSEVLRLICGYGDVLVGKL